MRWIGILILVGLTTACVPHRSMNEDPLMSRLRDLENRDDGLEGLMNGNRRAILDLRKRVDMLEKCQ